MERKDSRTSCLNLQQNYFHFKCVDSPNLTKYDPSYSANGVCHLGVTSVLERNSNIQSPNDHKMSMTLDQYRLNLYNYAVRMSSSTTPHWLQPYNTHSENYAMSGDRLATLSTLSMFPQSQRFFQSEEPKPQHSYIGLIAMAILSSNETKLVLSDIYQYILDNYPYFRSRGPGWRNSIRHNLSLNDCFIKSGRSANGKGHYWAIHPANMEDFRKGDFRRRKAQRKVRKHMGLSIDETSNDSESPPPVNFNIPPQMSDSSSFQIPALNPSYQQYVGQLFGRRSDIPHYTATRSAQKQHVNLLPEQGHSHKLTSTFEEPQSHHHQHFAYINSTTTTTIANLYSRARKRQFDVDSLLEPDLQIVDVVDTTRTPGASRARTQAQRTVITKVQVQKKQTIHSELLVDPPSLSSISNFQGDTDTEIDIDVDGDCEVDKNRGMFDMQIEGEPDRDCTISISPVLCSSSAASSSQNDSNSIEECSIPLPNSLSGPLTLSSMSLLRGYEELNYIDPRLLTRYYGSYMAAAAQLGSIE